MAATKKHKHLTPWKGRQTEHVEDHGQLLPVRYVMGVIMGEDRSLWESNAQITRPQQKWANTQTGEPTHRDMQHGQQRLLWRWVLQNT